MIATPKGCGFPDVQGREVESSPLLTGTILSARFPEVSGFSAGRMGRITCFSHKKETCL